MVGRTVFTASTAARDYKLALVSGPAAIGVADADRPPAAVADPRAEALALASCCSPLKLDDLQPDVLYHVLLFLKQADVAHMKMCSSRLRSNTLQASQHWAPRVENWLQSDPNSTGLLRQLRELDPQAQHPAADQQQASSAALPPHSVQLAAQQPQQQQQDGASAATGQTIDLDQQDLQEQDLQQDQQAAATDQQPGNSLSLQAPDLPAARTFPRMTKLLDWRQVWSFIERAQRGPWQLDVQALAPSTSPNGVLLTFELLLQQPAPLVEPGSCEQHTVGWRDSVIVMSFVLDRKTVEIVVDASGRVTSPQRDWCQGCIQLQPGQPRLLALEVSYIFPVPAWFLHPCTLAAPRPNSGSSCSGSSCGGSCASSVSGMVLDQSWDGYSTATAGSSLSSMNISQSAVLCSAAPFGRGDSCSLASSSLTSSGSLGNCAAMASSNSSCSNHSSGNPSPGRPRLSLDLSIGFGSYVIDPRYIDEAAPNQSHRGLERIELLSRVCWRPSKVQTWLGRLLPGIRGHSSSTGSSSSSSGTGAGSGAAGAAGAAAGAAACSTAGSGLKQGVKPSFAVSLSKAAAWQVPSDTDRRFAEGFMFWAVQHKLEQLLQQHGVLAPQGSTAVGPVTRTAARTAADTVAGTAGGCIS